MTDLPRQDGSGGAAGETITPPPRAGLGIRCTLLLVGLSLAIVLACGDPSESGPTVGTLAGTVHDAETEAPLEGALLVVGVRQGQSGADGTFEVDSVPTGTHQVTVSKDGYVGQSAEIDINGGETTTLALALVPDLGPPGPANVTAVTDDGAPGTVTVAWDPVEGATGYTVYWGTHSPANAEEGTAVPDAPNPFVHGQLSAGTTYYYTVVAHTPGGDTRPSAEVSATPDGPISIELVNPTPTQIVEARFVVSVEVRSIFQLLGVTAQVEDFTDQLTYIPASDEWEGFFDVGEMPSPSFRTVHYTATDAAGNVARTAVLVRLDHLPVVTLTEPMDEAFASSTIRVVATCTDDNPVGCEALVIQAGQGGGAVTKVTAQSSVDQTISLAEFDGHVVQLRAAGRDVVQSRVPRVSQVVRQVHVDVSSHLVPVASSRTGTLIDADASRLLAVDGLNIESPGTDTLRVVERTTGQSTVIHNVPQQQARNGALFPGGAIFVTGGTLKEWRNATVSDLATELSFFKTKGTYALWWAQSTGLIRRELTGGTNLSLPGAGNTQNDVAVTGEVAYWSSVPYEIFFHDDGGTEQLTNDGDEFANTYPVTDGIHVVYRRQPLPPATGPSTIRLSDPAGEITLASNLTKDLVPGEDYQVEEGWIAFVRPDAGNVRQVWRRSPAGEEGQVSAFGASSTIEAMGPGGEIVFTSEATGVERRYRARVSESPQDISSGLGTPIYIDGQLHLMMGATLLGVD